MSDDFLSHDALVRRACAVACAISLEAPAAGNFDGDQVLRRRADSAVARVRADGAAADGTFVVKLWTRPGLRGVLRRLTRTGSVLREYRNLRILHGAGMHVPRPIAYRPVRVAGAPYTDALLVEDIGPSITALTHVKQLLAAGRDDQLVAFEQDLIDMTATLIGAGVVDPDHGLLNVVVRPDGRAVRLDFEIARRVVFPRLAPRAYGQTLGRMIVSYTFAVQPDVARVRDFARRLVERLGPSGAALRHCTRYVRERLDRQRREKNLDLPLELPWETADNHS